MPPPPEPIGAERLSQLTQKESNVFVIAPNARRLFLYPSYFMHCTHGEGVGDMQPEHHSHSVSVWRFSLLKDFLRDF